MTTSGPAESRGAAFAPVGARLGAITSGGARAELWYAWVGDHDEQMLVRFGRDLLSDAEREHLAGYRFPGAAERYVVTRSLVRTVLGDRLGMAPRALEVSRTDTGKPIIAGGLHFNITHSGDLILLALCDSRAVGVDVERKRDVPRVDAMAARWLSAGEQAEMRRFRDAGTQASEAFLRVWSLKEARIKALGVGISGASRARLDLVPALPLDGLLHLVAARRGGPDYVGALAFA